MVPAGWKGRVLGASKQPPVRGAGSLVLQLSGRLRADILAGRFLPGEKLPSEARLTADYGVSRTVVREAVAALRADGLVEARQGAGVFVLGPGHAAPAPFQNIDYDRISSVLELLELRAAVEVEAAALAAARRSAQQEEQLVRCHQAVLAAIRSAEPTSEADFALHLSIAEASNNPRFREFLAMLGQAVIPRLAPYRGDDPRPADCLARLHREHCDIVDAICSGDPEAARDAMRRHLTESQSRYRDMLRRLRGEL